MADSEKKESGAATEPDKAAPFSPLADIARQIAVLVVRQHRRLLAEESHEEG